MINEEAAEQRSAHRSYHVRRADVAEISATLAWADDLSDDRLSPDRETAATEPLHGSERGQLSHRRREDAQRGARHEQSDRGKHHRLASEPVAELAVDRHHRRGGEQIAGDDHRNLIKPTKVLGHSGQGGRHDREVDSTQEHGQQEAREHHGYRTVHPLRHAASFRISLQRT